MSAALVRAVRVQGMGVCGCGSCCPVGGKLQFQKLRGGDDDDDDEEVSGILILEDALERGPGMEGRSLVPLGGL